VGRGVPKKENGMNGAMKGLERGDIVKEIF